MRQCRRGHASIFTARCPGGISLLLVLISLALLMPTRSWAGVDLVVSPAETVIAPGDTFNVELSVPAGMSPFNGYDAILGFDPTLLSLLPEVSASVREGELMVDACPTSRWNRFTVSPDSTQISISHVLLCGGVSVTGPGVLYRLRFAAKDALAVTSIQFLEGTAFYNAGVYVLPVTTQDGLVRIGQSTNTPPAAQKLGLRAVPNPFNPSTVFSFHLPRGGTTSLRILGVDGRLIKEMELGWLEAGAQNIPWDGTDQQGRHLASGHYLAHLRHAGGEAVCGAVLLK